MCARSDPTGSDHGHQSRLLCCTQGGLPHRWWRERCHGRYQCVHLVPEQRLSDKKPMASWLMPLMGRFVLELRRVAFMESGLTACAALQPLQRAVNNAAPQRDKVHLHWLVQKNSYINGMSRLTPPGVRHLPLRPCTPVSAGQQGWLGSKPSHTAAAADRL